MKRSEYDLIIVLPPFCVLIFLNAFFAVLVKCCNLGQFRCWIAKNVFSDILKEKKKEDGTSRWLFKDIDLTFHKTILHRLWFMFSMLFLGMLNGAILIFWQLLLLEVSSDCDVNDSSKDCFEGTVWYWPKEDPINCSSAAIQNGTTYVLCYKIVFNFGVATGATYGVFKLSMLAINLASNLLMMIENWKTLLAVQLITVLLFGLVVSVPLVLMVTPFGDVFLSNNYAVIYKILITSHNLLFFLFGFPWNKLTALNAMKNNPDYVGLENPDAATDDNERPEVMEIRGRRTYNSFSTLPRS